MNKRDRDIFLSKKRITLLESLKEQVVFFKERKTVGVMKTEHSIFIPSALMIDQAKETESFVKAARHINNTPQFNCPVLAEKRTVVKITGIEFVFQFNPNTDFDAIVNYLDEQIKIG